MRTLPILAAVLLAAPALAGCLGGGSDRGVARLNGLAGDVSVAGGDGVVVAVDDANRTLLVSIGGIPGNVTVVGADAGLRVARPDNASDATLVWRESLAGFEASSGIAAGGPVLARLHVGTAQSIRLGDEARTIVTAATEGTETTVFLRGSGRLVDGAATILFPAEFQLLVGEGPLTVQLTPTSPGPRLHVAEKAPDGFRVGSADATSEATFDWFVQATRAGTSGFRSVR